MVCLILFFVSRNVFKGFNKVWYFFIDSIVRVKDEVIIDILVKVVNL